MMTCIVVDDEPLAREGMAGYVGRVDFLELAGVGGDTMALEAMLRERRVDILLLDIEMPGRNGISFLQSLEKPPIVILTTAYPNYAIEGYSLNVVDYLLKPITFERFLQGVQKARDYFQLLHPPTSDTPDYFFIKCEQIYEKIFFQDILYVEAVENYVVFHTVAKKYMTLMTLSEVEKKLNDQHFMRVHKSYLVAINKIEQVDNYELVIRRMRVPVSRTYRSSVMDKLMGGKLWMRKL